MNRPFLSRIKHAIIVSVLLQTNNGICQIHDAITNSNRNVSNINANIIATNTQTETVPIKSAKAKLISPIKSDLKPSQYNIEEVVLNVFKLVPHAASSDTEARIDKILFLLPFTVVTDSRAKKIGVFAGKGDFYYSDDSDMVRFELGPGVLVWNTNFVEVPASADGIKISISKFEQDIKSGKINGQLIRKSINRIHLASVTPRYFFSDGYGPGGAVLMPDLESLEAEDGVLRLSLKNPATKKSALISIDIKNKKVVRSVVDGQEMNLNAGKPWALPLENK